MAMKRGATTIDVSRDEILAGNYSSAHVMQLARQTKVRAEKKMIPRDSIDDVFSEIKRQLLTSTVCPICSREYKVTEGKPGNSSLSIHRVRAYKGYTVGNIKAICNGCNKDIGECNGVADIEKKRRALDWQLTRLLEVK